MARKRMKGWELRNAYDGARDFASAWTKSEARAIFKQRLGIKTGRLPKLCSVERVLGV